MTVRLPLKKLQKSAGLDRGAASQDRTIKYPVRGYNEKERKGG